MSTNTHTAARPEERPYPDYDFWGETDDADADHGPADRQDPNDPALFIAHDIRKGRQGVVCGRSYDDEREVPLTEPTLYVGDTAGEMRHARRCNEETGWMNWGDGTWTRIPDGTIEELLADLDIWFEMSDRHFTAAQKVGLRELAERQKRQQHQNELSDTDIMRNVVEEARSPGGGR